MAPTRPLSLNKCNGSELLNPAAISPFRNITWPTSISRHDNTLKGDRKHSYNDIRKISKTRISPSSSSVDKHNSYLSINLHFYIKIGFFLAGAVRFAKKSVQLRATPTHFLPVVRHLYLFTYSSARTANRLV